MIGTTMLLYGLINPVGVVPPCADQDLNSRSLTPTFATHDGEIGYPSFFVSSTNSTRMMGPKAPFASICGAMHFGSRNLLGWRRIFSAPPP